MCEYCLNKTYVTPCKKVWSNQDDDIWFGNPLWGKVPRQPIQWGSAACFRTFDVLSTLVCRPSEHKVYNRSFVESRVRTFNWSVLKASCLALIELRFLVWHRYWVVPEETAANVLASIIPYFRRYFYSKDWLRPHPILERWPIMGSGWREFEIIWSSAILLLLLNVAISILETTTASIAP